MAPVNESCVDGMRVASGPVDITGSAAAARADAEKYRAEDPTYAELMATLAALGDLLEADPDPAECAGCCSASKGSTGRWTTRRVSGGSAGPCAT